MSMIERCMGVALGLLLVCSAADALACSSVAKVIYYSKADIRVVQVARGEAAGPVKPASDMLCAGDRVRVPAGVHVSIKYLTQNKSEIELHGPAEFPVTQIELPTKWAHSRNLLADVGKWFASADLDQTAGMVTRGGGCAGGGGIFSALDAGHDADAPFMLDASLGRLHFFWCGGTAPYAVEIAGMDGKPLVQQSVTEAAFSADLASVSRGQRLQLTVRSADGSLYTKQLLFKALQATSGDPYQSIVRLLYLDAEENWRLQLWSDLQEQPDSSIRSSLLQHLRAGDI